MAGAIGNRQGYAERYAALRGTVVEAWGKVQHHPRDADNDWNRRKQATSNLDAQIILAANPEEHESLVNGKEIR